MLGNVGSVLFDSDTTTATCEVTVPTPFVAVNIYVVVTEGETAFVPDAATAPTLGVIETLVAPVVVQDRVEDSPAVIVTGLAVKLAVGEPGEATLKTYTAL